MALTKARFSDYRALHRIADTLSPGLRRSFLEAVRDIRGQLDVGRLVELLDSGDAGQLGMFWHAVESDLAAAVRPALRTGVVASAQRVGAPLGLRFDLTNPHAVQVIDRQIATLVRDVTDESQRAIRTTLQRGFVEGRTVPEMARDIRNHVGLTVRDANAVANYRAAQLEAGVSPRDIEARSERLASRYLNRRAQRIAATETIRSAALGQQVAWQEARRTGALDADARQTWITTPDDDLCPICEELDGQEQPLGGFFRSSLGALTGPPAHPSCLPDYTLVASRDRVTAQSKRWYEGQLVVIRTAMGKELSATPNHPVLTDRGWVAAGSLDEGCNLVCHALPESVVPVDDDYGLMPTRIEEVPDALWQAGHVATREVPLAPEDFHGDGEGSHVAVIRTNSLLGDDPNPPGLEPPYEPLFVGRPYNGGRSHGLGPADQFSGAALPSLRGAVSGGHLTTPLGDTHLGPLQPLCVGLTPDGDIVLAEQSLNSPPGDALSLGELIDRYPSAVSVDYIVGIHWQPFAGHVYTIETDGGWYIASGIVVKNCRCALGLVTDDA